LNGLNLFNNKNYNCHSSSNDGHINGNGGGKNMNESIGNGSSESDFGEEEEEEEHRDFIHVYFEEILFSFHLFLNIKQQDEIEEPYFDDKYEMKQKKEGGSKKEKEEK